VKERDVPGAGRVQYPTGHDIQTEVNYVQLRAGGWSLAEIATIPGEIYPELVNGGIDRYRGADYPQARFEPVLRERLTTRYQFMAAPLCAKAGYQSSRKGVAHAGVSPTHRLGCRKL